MTSNENPPVTDDTEQDVEGHRVIIRSQDGESDSAGPGFAARSHDDEDDVEGHRVMIRSQDGESDSAGPGFAARSHDNEDDVEGHVAIRSHDDEDDVEGHRIAASGAAPGLVSGALSPEEKTQS